MTILGKAGYLIIDEAAAFEADDAAGVLLSYQVESNQLALEYQFLVDEKSRRIGLTYGTSPLAVEIAARSERPENVYYIGYNLDMAREFIGYCADFSKAFDQVVVVVPDDVSGMLMQNDDGDWLDSRGAFVDPASLDGIDPGAMVRIDGGDGSFLISGDAGKSVKAFRIDFPSGKSIIALPSSPRSVRGKQGTFIIDEAAFHDNLEELIKAILAALIWGGRVIVISTHDGTDNYFNTLIEEIRGGKRAGHVHRITFNDAIAAGLYRRICLVQGKAWSAEAQAAWEADIRKTYGDAADEELDVIPARGSGTYLARATIIEAMSGDLPVIRLRCPDGFERGGDAYRRDWLSEFLETEVRPWLTSFDASRRSFMGQDFARSGDVSPVMFGQFDQYMRLHTRLTLEMRNVPFSDQEFVIAWIIARVPHFSRGKVDARGNGSALAEKLQMLFGFEVIEAVMATDKTYLAFMPKLKAGIEDRTFILPRDDGVLDDLRMIKLVRGIPKIPDRSANVREDGKIVRRHGDTAIAAMHLIAAADDDPGAFEALAAGVRASAASDEYGITSRGFGTVARRSQGMPSW